MADSGQAMLVSRVYLALMAEENTKSAIICLIFSLNHIKCC